MRRGLFCGEHWDCAGNVAPSADWLSSATRFLLEALPVAAPGPVAALGRRGARCLPREASVSLASSSAELCVGLSGDSSGGFSGSSSGPPGGPTSLLLGVDSVGKEVPSVVAGQRAPGAFATKGAPEGAAAGRLAASATTTATLLSWPLPLLPPLPEPLLLPRPLLPPLAAPVTPLATLSTPWRPLAAPDSPRDSAFKASGSLGGTAEDDEDKVRGEVRTAAVAGTAVARGRSLLTLGKLLTPMEEPIEKSSSNFVLTDRLDRLAPSAPLPKLGPSAKRPLLGAVPAALLRDGGGSSSPKRPELGTRGLPTARLPALAAESARLPPGKSGIYGLSV
mmetsp:Transcript_43137/g.78008  ORF Transcript_43137/g.78008 Transcript_43137/m.78008 type:complete len:336 (+) Transcript_43137:1072-2079(+)